MNGLVIPRDASQQINEGILVDQNRNWDNLNEGDLMFLDIIEMEKEELTMLQYGLEMVNLFKLQKM